MEKRERRIVKNISGQTLFVVGYGKVDANATVEVESDFNNANFSDVVSEKPKTQKEVALD